MVLSMRIGPHRPTGSAWLVARGQSVMGLGRCRVDSVCPTQLLRLAADIPRPAFDKAAHALGWPDTRSTCHSRGRGRVNWESPYRNKWLGSAADPDWGWLQRHALARISGRGAG